MKEVKNDEEDVLERIRKNPDNLICAILTAIAVLVVPALPGPEVPYFWGYCINYFVAFSLILLLKKLMTEKISSTAKICLITLILLLLSGLFIIGYATI